MTQSDTPLHRAMLLHNAGQFADAENAYRAILSSDPNDPNAMHLLGLVLHQTNRTPEGKQLILRSVELSPDNPEYHNNLGEVLRLSQDLPSAIAAYQRAIALRPDFPEPRSNLGLLYLANRDPETAIAYFRDAIRLNPQFAEAHQHLGNALREQGDLPEALAELQTAVNLNPTYARAWYRGGLTLASLDRHDEAITAFQQALRLQPNNGEVMFHLGLSFRAIGRNDLAGEWWEKSIPLRGDDVGSSINLAGVRVRQGRLSDAITILNETVRLRPDNPVALNNLGNVLADQGKIDNAITIYKQSLAIDPTNVIAHSNLLFTLNHHPDYPPARLFEEHLGWSRIHADALIPAARDFPNDRNPDRQLRIGYVSADFRDNQVGFFLEPLLQHHNRSDFHIKCYSDVERADTVTERMQRFSAEWENIRPFSDTSLVDRILNDRIDILVDLTVHAGRHRLITFAHKPAPLQLTYLGYPNTTGLSAIDYRLTDIHLDPPGLTEPFHAEKLLRLPETYFCYRPAAGAPKIGPLPYLKEGRITFGSFNRLSKLSEPTISLWSQILKAVPRSRLLLKSQGLADVPTCVHLAERFLSHGIPPERLEMQGWTSTPDYLSLMNRIDIALDPFPFNGGTTTCHHLYMGLPVITLAGPSPVGRIGVSLLSNVHLQDLIAQSPDQYIQIAASLAKDTPRLSKLRSTLRDRMRTSPLMNAPRFASHVESAYRTIWRRWCANLPPDHITLSNALPK